MEGIMNKQITLAARPVGLPKDSDFKLVEAPVPQPGTGEFLVQGIWLSLDPYMRGRMNEARGYADPTKIGEVMTAGVTGQIIESKHPGFAVGDYVSGQFGWQQYAVSNGAGVRKVDPSVAPLSTSLGVLGMPGLTAYFGFLEICQPKAGETVVVSGGAGAVGSYVGQIAKIKGCRVVGIAGTDDKVNFMLNDLGFDAAYNYKTFPDARAKLMELCPKGIDCYFDNVGGSITDAVFTLLNPLSRVSICGQIALYNLEKPELGPRLLPLILTRQVKVQGFLVFQFASQYAEGFGQLTQWVQEGKLKYREDVVEGIENAPRAFIGMLQGANTGKQLVKLK